MGLEIYPIQKGTNYVEIANDLVGLAKDNTLQELTKLTKKEILAPGYSTFTIPPNSTVTLIDTGYNQNGAELVNLMIGYYDWSYEEVWLYAYDKNGNLIYLSDVFLGNVYYPYIRPYELVNYFNPKETGLFKCIEPGSNGGSYKIYLKKSIFAFGFKIAVTNTSSSDRWIGLKAIIIKY